MQRLRVSGTTISSRNVIYRLSAYCLPVVVVTPSSDLPANLEKIERVQGKQEIAQKPVEWIALSRAAMRPDGLDCDLLRSDGQ